jgi:tetraacyldisaccharide 4'-kinase
MSLPRWPLLPLAPFYAIAVRAKNRAFDANPEKAERVPRPVLSIGNLSVGGTGKTPIALHLAQELDKVGHKNIIISRGYRGRRDVDPMDVPPESNPSETGDEPAMMARRLGPNRVIVGRSRHAAALRAISSIPDAKLLIMDDGFQHRKLHRDVDLLLLDGIRKWGNGKLLPLGDLREPMTGAKRAHALIVTRGSKANKDEVEKWWSEFGSGGPIFYVDFRIASARNAATGKRLALPVELGPLFAFCALGNPQALYGDLLAAGLTLVGSKSFRDHKALSPSKIEKLARLAANSGAAGLICTEKDAVKLTDKHLAASGLPIWVAEQEVRGAAGLVGWIVDTLNKLPLAK